MFGGRITQEGSEEDQRYKQNIIFKVKKNFGVLTTQVGRVRRGRHCGGRGGKKEVVGQSDPAEEEFL